MTKLPHILCGLMALCLWSNPSIAHEVTSFPYSDKPLPAGMENEGCSFSLGPNGEKSRAHLEWLAKNKAKEDYKKNTPRFKQGEIRFVASAPIPGLPDRKLWTYRISGLTVSNRPVGLSMTVMLPDRLKLAVPINCKIDGTVTADKFDPDLLKGIPHGESICDQIKVVNGVTYFEKSIPSDADAVNISVVATAKPALPLISVQATVDGFQPIESETPGPEIDM